MSEKLTTEAPPPYSGVYPAQQPGYPPDQGGYPPDQGGYPPQQYGYPDQGGYPGYPQQTGYPDQGGYPQQSGYPPQQGQAGYPKQSYPQSAYPTQPQHAQQQTTANVVVVSAQPTVRTVQLTQRKPDNLIILSLFSMLFCCLLFGIIALIYSLQVDSSYNSGDYAAALHSSLMARRWNIIAIVSGVIVIVIIGVLGGVSRSFYYY